MKKLLVILFIVIFITLILPLCIIRLVGKLGIPKEYEPPDSAGTVAVYLSDEGRVADMDINAYLTGVVAAEMPADFEYEALKAQAVAARTYLYSRMEQLASGNISESHNGAAVCTDYTHCQAYTDREAPDNIISAVNETTGEYMTYNGEIISALFHSTSSGATEAAVDVWGSDVPYLQSVPSVGDMESPKYLSSLTLSAEDFKATAEETLDGTDWSNPLFSDIERSKAGGIITLKIGGVSVRGTDFRTMYGLRSTNAELTEKDGNVIMSVRGYGHGVGMSQYGADYMAKNGSSYDEILKTYYTGIEIVKK